MAVSTLERQTTDPAVEQKPSVPPLNNGDRAHARRI